jgi:glycosyltransferase involved in cell wall biosynthesis
LNRAIDSARGEFIVRLDGHNVYTSDFIRKVVKLSENTAADNAGGVLVPTGKGYAGESIAAAYHSPLGIGGAQRGHFSTDEIRRVDTVHGGCWRRERLIAVGKFDEEMVRNQDDELSFRIRKDGGVIVQSTAIRIRYWVRDSFRKLFWQFAQYGYWKVKVVRRHPRQASLRHFVPALFLTSLVLSSLAAIFWSAGMWALICLLGLYFVAILAASVKLTFHFSPRLLPGIMLSLIFMQVGYGWGSLMGLRRWLTGPISLDSVFERVTR